jgi:2-dehydropantoate 2-reductase
MKIAVMGAGGVGGFYGAKLAQAGEDVTFIARGAHLAALRERGLRVEGDAARIALPRVQATDDPAQVGPVELVLFTTKAYDLERAARQMQPMIGAQTTVLPLLNGADIAERLGAVVGAPHVLGGLVQISARIAEPGLVRQMGPLNKIIFGELSGELSPRARAIEACLQHADISVVVSREVRSEIWKKFLFIAAAGGVCAVTGSLLGLVLADPDTRALYAGCMAEIAALAHAKGVPLPATVVQDTLTWSDGLPPQTRPSMLHSLEQGQRLEVDTLNGAAARIGAELGVPTPVNAFIFAALKLRAEGRATG